MGYWIHTFLRPRKAFLKKGLCKQIPRPEERAKRSLEGRSSWRRPSRKPRGGGTVRRQHLAQAVQIAGASFEASLRFAPQDEVVGGASGQALSFEPAMTATQANARAAKALILRREAKRSLEGCSSNPKGLCETLAPTDPRPNGLRDGRRQLDPSFEARFARTSERGTCLHKPFLRGSSDRSLP